MVNGTIIFTKARLEGMSFTWMTTVLGEVVLYVGRVRLSIISFRDKLVIDENIIVDFKHCCITVIIKTVSNLKCFKNVKFPLFE
jgi:hypothetical protein